MSYHIISIDSPQCALSCKDGQFACQLPDGSQRRLPMEDIASIIISGFSATIHGQVLLEAAKKGVSVVMCENHRPTSLVLPANRCTDTLLTRALISLTEKNRSLLWQKTVDAKCTNQLRLARHHSAHHSGLAELENSALGKKPHKEAICAKLYWPIVGDCLDQHRPNEPEIGHFTRQQKGTEAVGFNSLLNYGYAVLMTCVLQKLLAVGLDPTFGISHATRERSTPLAYDLMEPFRPVIDHRALQWTARLPSTAKIEVNKEFKRWIVASTLHRLSHLDTEMELHMAVETVIRSFRRAVAQNNPALYKPWTPTNLKWAGSW